LYFLLLLLQEQEGEEVGRWRVGRCGGVGAGMAGARGGETAYIREDIGEPLSRWEGWMVNYQVCFLHSFWP